MESYEFMKHCIVLETLTADCLLRIWHHMMFGISDKIMTSQTLIIIIITIQPMPVVLQNKAPKL